MAVALLIVGGVGAAAEQQAPSGTRLAKCIVRICSDRDLLPISPEMVESLLASTPVVGAPAREMLGSKADNLDDVVNISFELLDDSRSGWGSVLTGSIEVDVHGDGARPVAEEFLSAICERLEQALRRVGEVDRERLRARLEKVQAELAQLNAQYEQICAARKALIEQAGRDDLSRARIADTINQLEDHKQEIELALAGSQAREAALTEQIAKISQQAIEAAEKSGVVKELAEIVDIRKMEFARAQQLQESGQASVADLNEAQEALSRARADLARYRESMSEQAGAGLLAQLNHELVNLSIESAQQEARLVAVQQRLASIRDRHLLELADRYEREVELQLELTERATRVLTEEQFELEEDIRNLQLPEVVVVGQ
jgi:hypothetical protein